jgi:uncharacterized protein YjiS (DUF1127 family)
MQPIIASHCPHRRKDRDALGRAEAHCREHRQAAGKRKTVLPITSCWRFLLIIANMNKLPGREPVMSTITTTTFRATQTPRWDQLKFRISEWHRRARSRRELEALSDATLRDIGITRCDAHREMNKPSGWHNDHRALS